MLTLEVLSRDEIETRRAQLLAEIEMTEDEVRERARSYTLSPHETGILAEIDGLDFLLGE